MHTGFPTKKTLELDQKYASQGDISGRRTPKKVITSGRGHMLFDDQGSSYLDFQLCNGAAPFGYRFISSRAQVTPKKNRKDTILALNTPVETPVSVM